MEAKDLELTPEELQAAWDDAERQLVNDRVNKLGRLPTLFEYRRKSVARAATLKAVKAIKDFSFSRAMYKYEVDHELEALIKQLEEANRG